MCESVYIRFPYFICAVILFITKPFMVVQQAENQLGICVCRTEDAAAVTYA